MKTFGGLTHGRDVSDSVLARWTQEMTALQYICYGIERCCGVDLISSDQHLKISDSRVQRGNDDCRKIVEWFKCYNPFPENSNLISISTGVVGDSRINRHMAKEEALALAPIHPSVVVIGEDIDLFVILIGIFTFDNVYFLQPGKGKFTEKIFSPLTALEKTTADNILFIHAMSGCDTTSALFNYSKMKFVQTLKNNPDLLKEIEIFKNPDIIPEAVVDTGNRFLVALYGYPISASDTSSLNKVC
ncbi:hypothetical protein AVEN_255935-1 [Araneus ventricosus]|uniref:Uncharacterized protein n=1 Tax=Araneus ventricosus TaxID=182803 RepID=A0A4Y2KLN7_ARAVE|nr:hypothetical protein AVEN_255935-1 [Araneus ventricosus]